MDLVYLKNANRLHIITVLNKKIYIGLVFIRIFYFTFYQCTLGSNISSSTTIVVIIRLISTLVVMSIINNTL